MAELKSINYINEYDIMDLTGKTADYFGFLCEADSNTYVPLECGDDELARLWEEYEHELARLWEEYEHELFLDEAYAEEYISDPDERELYMSEHSGAAYVANLIKLVEALRAMGVRDEVLVYVSW